MEVNLACVDHGVFATVLEVSQMTSVLFRTSNSLKFLSTKVPVNTHFLINRGGGACLWTYLTAILA